MKLIKEDNRGKVFQSENIKIFYRNKGTISGDNDKNKKELIYLVSGRAEVTLKDEIWKIEAPAKIEFRKATYHKIEALEDIIFILIE